MCVYHVAQAGLELVIYVAKDDFELQIFHPRRVGQVAHQIHVV